MNREVQNFVGSKVAVSDIGDVRKRACDIVLAALALILLLPAMALIALILFIQDGRPILFSHRRIGRGSKEFSCLKFRTMKRDAEKRLADLLQNCEASRQEWEANQKLKNDPRVTKFGHFLRRSSLDELPQLFNVLRGEMSLVGPRPIVRAEIPRYADAYAYYASVRPGVTGLWQINGRNDTSYSERVRLDVQYVRTGTFKTDLIILIKTIAIVLLGRGSY
jgi:lipopolysaccharide/colanic/teichoic acid biosynthesis glycosyltransferase